MKPLKFLAIAAIAATSLAACMNLKKDVAEDIKATQKGPEYAPTKNITNFSEALRCMDDMMVSHGVEKFSVLAEDLTDQTKKVSAGTRDMLITAISDMTKRSRAVNMIVFGNDSGNLISYLAQSGKQNVYNEVPKFDIRGSISQLDKDIVTKEFDAGISIPEVGFGVATSAAGTILGLDMSMVRTADMSLVQGVTSRNSILIFTTGKGGDADGTIRKAGINFGLNFGNNEGQTQALRNLVELATVELFGKLLKLPYWSCLGADPSHESITQEIDDWYVSMKANNELIGFSQNQLFKRGYYSGVVDGQTSPEFEKSVALFKLSQKMPNDPEVDKAVFASMLTTRMPDDAKTRIATRTIPEPVQSPPVQTETNLTPATAGAAAVPAPTAEIQPESGSPATESTQSNAASGDQPTTASISVSFDSSISLAIKPRSNKQLFNRGENVTLVVSSNRKAHMYCFYHDDDKQIQRVFPNRFRKTSLINAGEEIDIPGNMPFAVTASERGIPETIGCFTTEREVLKDLPTNIRVLDFVNLDVKSMEDIRNSLERVAGSSLSEAYFQIKTQ